MNSTRLPTAAPSRLSSHTVRTLALIALSGIALGLWWVRATTWTPGFHFLWWNLFLAWVPWVVSLVLPRVKPGALFWLLTAVWLAFFPNAPYLLTDLVHLKWRSPIPLWFDVLFLASFAWAGCLVGWDSLSRVHDALLERYGALRAGAFVMLCVALCGVGVFLGRFERLNSWELVTAPTRVFASSIESLQQPRALLFCVAFAAFVGAGYVFTRARTSASHAAE